eukprot:3878215-Prymnesium_polylepis.1
MSVMGVMGMMGVMGHRAPMKMRRPWCAHPRWREKEKEQWRMGEGSSPSTLGRRERMAETIAHNCALAVASTAVRPDVHCTKGGTALEDACSIATWSHRKGWRCVRA